MAEPRNSINVPHLSKPKIKEFKEAFNLIDQKNNGFITANDLQSFMKNLMGVSLPMKYINEMVLEVDRNGSARIEFAEFVTVMMMMETVQGDEDTELIEAFRVFDTTQDGNLGNKELANVLTTLGDGLSSSELETLLFLGDMDEDGYVDYQEFVRMIFDRK